MDKKNILIFTIGNRDVQFLKQYDEMFELQENYILKKDNNFFNNSKKVYENLEKDIGIENIKLPIIKPIINKFVKIKKIILISTNQSPNNNFDTLYFAKIIEKCLDKDMSVEIKEINFNPMIIENYKDFFVKIFDKYPDENYNVILGVSGGLPQTRTVIYLSALFRNNVSIEELNEKTKRISNENGNFFGKYILKNKINSAIQKYNYNFINEFKSEFNEDFQKEFDKVYELYLFIKRYDEEDLLKRYEEQLNDLLSHILMQWRVENYSSFLGELFSYLQNLGHYLFLRIVSEKVILPNNEEKSKFGIASKKKNVEIFLEKYVGKFLNKYYSKIIEEKEGKFYLKNTDNDVGKEVWINDSAESLSYVFSKINETSSLDDFLKSRLEYFIDFYKKIKQISQLRNKSIIAHSLKGATKNEISKKLDIDLNIDEFLIENFKKIVKIEFKNQFEIYNKNLIIYLQ